jgi:hypothetical protein
MTEDVIFKSLLYVGFVDGFEVIGNGFHVISKEEDVLIPFLIDDSF